MSKFLTDFMTFLASSVVVSRSGDEIRVRILGKGVLPSVFITPKPDGWYRIKFGTSGAFFDVDIKPEMGGEGLTVSSDVSTAIDTDEVCETVVAIVADGFLIANGMNPGALTGYAAYKAGYGAGNQLGNVLDESFGEFWYLRLYHKSILWSKIWYRRIIGDPYYGDPREIEKRARTAPLSPEIKAQLRQRARMAFRS